MSQDDFKITDDTIFAAGVLVRSKGKYLLGKVTGSKVDQAWTIFKGCYDEKDKGFLDTALRELKEESNISVTLDEAKNIVSLCAGMAHHYTVKKSNKLVIVYFLDDPSGRLHDVELKCNSFFGKNKDIPEICSYKWFVFDELRDHLLKSQQGLVDTMEDFLSYWDGIRCE